MARDRQRAKQRRRARAANPDGTRPGAPARAELSDELDHSTYEVDEFEAAMVTGSGQREANADAQAAFGEEAEEAALEREAVASAPAAARAAERPPAPTKRGPARFIAFLRACWSELQRVQWPDRRQVAQATAVVIGFVIVAGLYLGVADYAAKELVNAII
ncbi:MAG: preprotein translocase subunit SecE [Solirubrobacteraceae bacterium]